MGYCGKVKGERESVLCGRSEGVFGLGGNPSFATSNEGIAGRGMLMYILLNEGDCIVMKGVRIFLTVTTLRPKFSRFRKTTTCILLHQSFCISLDDEPRVGTLIRWNLTYNYQKFTVLW